MRKLIGDIFTGVSFIVILWGLISWIDICAHNLNGGTEWSYNLFVLLFP